MLPTERRLAAILATLVGLAFALPFTLLRPIKAWYGAGLFWVIFVLIVAGILTYQTRGWQPDSQRGDTTR